MCNKRQYAKPQGKECHYDVRVFCKASVLLEEKRKATFVFLDAAPGTWMTWPDAPKTGGPKRDVKLEGAHWQNSGKSSGRIILSSAALADTMGRPNPHEANQIRPASGLNLSIGLSKLICEDDTPKCLKCINKGPCRAFTPSISY